MIEAARGILGDGARAEQLADALRELTGEGPGPALLLLEENDEHLAVVRVDGGVGSLDEPRVFLSDRRAVQASDVAKMLWEDPGAPVEAAAEEGLLPADVLSALCERAGCDDVLEQLREG